MTHLRKEIPNKRPDNINILPPGILKKEAITKPFYATGAYRSLNNAVKIKQKIKLF